MLHLLLLAQIFGKHVKFGYTSHTCKDLIQAFVDVSVELYRGIHFSLYWRSTCVIKKVTFKGVTLCGKNDCPCPKEQLLKGKNPLPQGANSFL